MKIDMRDVSIFLIGFASALMLELIIVNVIGVQP